MGSPTGGAGGLPGSDRHGRLVLPVLIAIAALLLAAAPAQASFHLLKVREVHPGAANDSYVVLQMLAKNENQLGGHSLRLYDSSGGTIHTFTFTGGSCDVYGYCTGGYVAPSAGHGNNTVLVGDTGVQAAFEVAPDDHSDASLNIPSAGGAVCWLSGEPIDCVSWGNFSGAASLPSAAGTPVSPGGVTPGKALHRSIASGCSTWFHAGDDSDDSATDFSEQPPDPRSNAAVPTETECVAPNTAIDSATVPNGGRTNLQSIEFTFSANPSAGATFECKLEGGGSPAAFVPCTSPQEYSSLDGDDTAAGTAHSFQVRAENADGTDQTPATHSWTVDTVAPTTTITNQPANPSAGTSAAFNFNANETATFQCSLAQGAGPDSYSGCSSGKTYNGLPDGEHTFKVKATDQAGNTGDTDTYTWVVDNSLADTTPPETTILSKPPNPSSSSTASFTYSSNEPGSTFECKLDGAGFSACAATGITYTGLANGTHSFQVRARDPEGNLDPSPAGHTFDVVVLVEAPPAPAALPPPPLIPPPPGPGTALAAGVAEVRGAMALLRISCRGRQGARCKGVLRLVAPVGGARGSRRKARRLVIGSAGFSLPLSSRLRTVRVRLTAQGKRLVRRAGRRGLRVSLVGRGVRKRALRLRPAPRGTRQSRWRDGRGAAR
jgi:hypothetical protein